MASASMAPVRSHGTRKGCHYYTTLERPLTVYSSGRACPCHVRLPLPCSLAPAMPAIPSTTMSVVCVAPEVTVQPLRARPPQTYGLQRIGAMKHGGVWDE